LASPPVPLEEQAMEVSPASLLMAQERAVSDEIFPAGRRVKTGLLSHF
jgi:hypothetical protein